jgi:hypothetical protein
MMGGLSSFGDTRRRRRRAFYGRLLQFLLTVAAVVAMGGYAYQVGVSASQSRSEKLEADLLRFQESNLELHDRLAVTTQRAGQAESALATLRRRYAEDVPQDELALLLAQIRSQRAKGVAYDRLALLIDAAERPASCEPPATKRFVPRTPVSAGPVSYVRFDDRITVTGTGESARNDAGLPEAWFDPGQPVRLAFRTLDGEVVSVEGVVPLSHRMVVGDREYRFSVVPGERQFLEVSGQACAFPQEAGPEPEPSPSADEEASLG